ncbi:unnamed protein product [Aphanomyces euteiches]|uniref:Uncharacterized protein n=1 Tax=Aphanomyces euteiches TaxID=100861 RepID=A0A6G0WJW1_9STRA|nr:hypothetical protein Ae201684_014375 [Aphanomyces euteiches]KAH9088909.1 hypothetical protein Ae201684P_013121 [Aphanomyces euteiches]KAH9158211.1 hypothetical protein AeRB84_000044 [Aphanomyces euteiches]
MSDLRDAFKAITLLKDALTKKKQELAVCKAQMKEQEEQHLLDIQTLQEELNRTKAAVSLTCQHHGQGLEALQRQHAIELKKLRDELEIAVQFSQRNEEARIELATELQTQKQINNTQRLELHKLKESAASLQSQLEAQIAATSELSNSFSALQVESTSLKETIVDLNMQLHGKDQELTALHDQTSTLRHELNSAKSSIASLKAELDSKRQLAHSLEAKIIQLQVDKVQQDDEIVSLQQSLAQKRDEVRRFYAVNEPEATTATPELETTAVHKAKMEAKYLEWQQSVRLFSTDLQAIKQDVQEMSTYGLSALDHLHGQLPSHDKLQAALQSVRNLRGDCDLLKQGWTASMSVTLIWLETHVQTQLESWIQREREEMRRKTTFKLAEASEVLENLRGELDHAKDEWKATLQHTSEQHAIEMLILSDRIRVALPRSEALERHLMALEDTSSPYFRKLSPSTASSWQNLEATLRELKSPFHRLLQTLERANYLLKLLIRNADALQPLRSRALEKHAVGFADLIKALVVALDDATLAGTVAQYTNVVHETLYSWHACDSSYLDGIPVPSFGMESPVVDHVLTSWTANVSHRTDASEWLCAVFMDHPTSGSTFYFENLTREVKDAFLVLIVPLIKSKRQLVVHMKRQEVTDDRWDLKMEVLQSYPSPNQTEPQSAMFKAIERRLSQLQK